MKEAIQTRDTLEFEDFKGMKVSKPFETKNGDSISLVYISESKALLKSRSGDFTVQVNGPIDDIVTDSIAKSFLGGLWDKLKNGIGTLIGILTGGGSGQPAGCNVNSSGAVVTVINTGSAPVNINLNAQCTGPQ